MIGQRNKYHAKMSNVSLDFRYCCRHGTHRQLDGRKWDNVRAQLCRNHKNGPCDLNGSVIGIEWTENECHYGTRD